MPTPQETIFILDFSVDVSKQAPPPFGEGGLVWHKMWQGDEPSEIFISVAQMMIAEVLHRIRNM